MSLFNKARPQDSFENVWSESSFVTHLIWEMTLAIHSSDSEEVKTNLLEFLEEKSDEMSRMSEQLYNIRREVVDIFYKHFPEPHEKEWYFFVKELGSFQESIVPISSRLFILRDILLQIDEAHPKRKELEAVFEESFNNLLKAKELTEKITMENERSYRAVFDAIILARSIKENVSFEDAEKIEKRRWE